MLFISCLKHSLSPIAYSLRLSLNEVMIIIKQNCGLGFGFFLVVIAFGGVLKTFRCRCYIPARDASVTALGTMSCFFFLEGDFFIKPMINNLPVWEEQNKVIFFHFVFFFSLGRPLPCFNIVNNLCPICLRKQKKKLEENVKVELLLLTKTSFHYSYLI